MGASYSSLRRTKVLYATRTRVCNLLSTPALDEISRDILTPVNVLCDCYTKIFCGLFEYSGSLTCLHLEEEEAVAEEVESAMTWH